MLYLTLRQYQYVCAVAHHGSLSAAATALHVSQPALSTALTRVEAQLGYGLFLRRRGAALALTPQGRDFAIRAQGVLDQAKQLENPDAAATGPQQIRLGCFADLAPFLLAPALQILRASLPGLRVEFSTDPFEPLIAALSKSQIDLAISYDLGLDASFTRQPLGRIAPQAVMAPGHPLAAQVSLTLAELSAYPLVLSQEGLSVQHMLSLFRSQGLTPRVAHRAASLELLRSLAAHGEGLGLSYSLPPGRLSYDGKPLCAVPISDPGAAESIVLVSHGPAQTNTPIDIAQTALAAQLPDHLNLP